MTNEEKNEVKKVIEDVEDALEGLLECEVLRVRDNELQDALEHGFTLNTGEGMPTWEIKLVPCNLRDTMIV